MDVRTGCDELPVFAITVRVDRSFEHLDIGGMRFHSDDGGVWELATHVGAE